MKFDLFVIYLDTCSGSYLSFVLFTCVDFVIVMFYCTIVSYQHIYYYLSYLLLCTSDSILALIFSGVGAK